MTEAEERKLQVMERWIGSLTRQKAVFILELSTDNMLAMVASLQLSLRHPENTGSCSKVARAIVDAMIRQTETLAPGLAAIMREGNDPSQDVKR